MSICVANHYKNLSNGIKIPVIGFGTNFLNQHGMPQESEKTSKYIYDAIKVGYRLIDTAEWYGNEDAVGVAIEKCIQDGIVQREDLFVSTKLNVHKVIGYDIAKNSFAESLAKLKLDYVDLYLMHGPALTPDDGWKKLNAETWRAFEELYESGKVRAIGVSNFMIYHLEELFKTSKIKPMINQIELHPQWQQKELVKFCAENSVLCEAWSPLMSGRALKSESFVNIAEKYNKSAAQILLRWSLQKGFIPIPKSSNLERMQQNLDVFDFALSSEELLLLDDLNSHPLNLITPDCYWLIYTYMDQMNTIVEKKRYKLFGKINIVSARVMSDNKSYVYYFLGFIPILKKKVQSNMKQKLYLFGVLPIFTISKKLKLIGRTRIPNYLKGNKNG